MLSEHTRAAFFDELAKIAESGGLVTAAVPADSAVVDGPGVKPFTRQKGYKRLSPVIEKEAAIKLPSMQQIKYLPSKFGDEVRNQSIRLYQKPGVAPLVKATEFAAGGPSADASDMRYTAAIQMLRRLVGGG